MCTSPHKRRFIYGLCGIRVLQGSFIYTYIYIICSKDSLCFLSGLEDNKYTAERFGRTSAGRKKRKTTMILNRTGSTKKHFNRNPALKQRRFLMGVPLLNASVEPIVAGHVEHINIIPSVFSFNPLVPENGMPKS